MPFVGMTLDRRTPAGTAFSALGLIKISRDFEKRTLFADSIRVRGSHTYSRNQRTPENSGPNGT